LRDSALGLGKSLDNATEEYNKKYRLNDPLGKVGGTVALVIRSTGGLYIRIRQASILKATIKEAVPLIAGLMDDVRKLALKIFKPSLLNYENNYLQADFKSLANNRKHVDLCAVLFVYDNLYKTRQSIILADSVANAAETYKEAHADLVENTRVKKTLKEAISQIQALSAEISAANKLKEKVK
jgi:hypothetical protein